MSSTIFFNSRHHAEQRLHRFQDCSLRPEQDSATRAQH